MRSWKKKLSGFIAVLVFTTTVLSNFTFNRAFADTGTDSKGKRLTAVDITDNVSDEVKLGYFEDALNEHTIENIDMPKADDEVWVIVQMEQESLVERAARQRTGATVSEFVNSNEG